MLNLPGINDAQYYTGSTVSTESLNRADAQMRNLLRVGGQLFDMAINAAQINEAVATGRANRASVEGLYGNILGNNGRVIRVSTEGVSDMASDAWEALKNWIKELIRKVEDFFLKYSVFLKKTKQKLKDLRSYVRTKLGGQNPRMIIDAAGEGVRDKWDGERILDGNVFVTLFSRGAFGITLTDQEIRAAASIQDDAQREAEQQRLATRSDNEVRANVGNTAARADARLSREFTHGMDRSELKLKLDDQLDERLDEALDEDNNRTGVNLLDLARGQNAIADITYTAELYYKVADLIIKTKEQAVKDYDRMYKSVAKLKAGLNNQALRSIRQRLHQSLLALFKISSAFRKNASKLIKFVMSITNVNENRNGNNP